MIAWLLFLIFGKNKFLPNSYCKSIYDVNYNKLYDEGCRIILSDLDNTLISYLENEPNDLLIEWKNHLKSIGFEVMIVSNSSSDRVKNFAKMIDLDCQYSSMKPTKKGFKKANKHLNIQDNSKVVLLGDQILTDILGGNRMGYRTILIEAIDRLTERKCTRFNRFIERKVVKKIKSKDPNGVLKNYE